MKLKTLKDLGPSFLKDLKTGILTKTVGRAELKAEAIKWVKDIRKRMDIGKRVGRMSVEESENGYIATYMWIMNFFNISEEDLEWHIIQVLEEC